MAFPPSSDGFISLMERRQVPLFLLVILKSTPHLLVRSENLRTFGLLGSSAAPASKRTIPDLSLASLTMGFLGRGSWRKGGGGCSSREPFFIHVSGRQAFQ